MLKPALRRLWRDPGTLQLGMDPSYGVVIDGIEVEDASLIALLDGTRDRAALDAEAARLGYEPGRVARLIDTLSAAHALEDSRRGQAGRAVDGRHQPDLLSLSLLHPRPGAAHDVMSARQRSRVDVLGAGRVGASVAMLLAAAGVGTVEVADNGPVRHADFSPGGVRRMGSRQASRAEAARAVLGGTGSAPGTAAAAGERAVVVLAPTASIVPPEWLGQVRHQTHLPVIIRETTAVIGPLVIPGRTPCLRCVELTRGDRDPAWPLLAAQLIGTPREIEPCDIALASAAASIVALHVLSWIDRGPTVPPPSLGGTVELSLADLRLRRRSVNAHPGCGCGAIESYAPSER